MDEKVKGMFWEFAGGILGLFCGCLVGGLALFGFVTLFNNQSPGCGYFVTENANLLKEVSELKGITFDCDFGKFDGAFFNCPTNLKVMNKTGHFCNGSMTCQNDWGPMIIK